MPVVLAFVAPWAATEKYDGAERVGSTAPTSALAGPGWHAGLGRCAAVDGAA